MHSQMSGSRVEFGFLTASSATKLSRGQVPRLTSDNAATHETERGDHAFCLRQSHYTDTDSASRSERADRTQDLLTRSHALYPLSYRTPPEWRLELFVDRFTFPLFRVCLTINGRMTFQDWDICCFLRWNSFTRSFKPVLKVIPSRISILQVGLYLKLQGQDAYKDIRYIDIHICVYEVKITCSPLISIKIKRFRVYAKGLD